MADPNFSWIYIILFLAIPLARIIPRLLAKKGIGKSLIQQSPKEQSESKFEPYRQSPETQPSKPVSDANLVLGALNQGSKSFESLQKNTGLGNQELDSILEDLEKNGMLKVVHKQGMFGPKTELHPTDRGFKEYYS